MGNRTFSVVACTQAESKRALDVYSNILKVHQIMHESGVVPTMADRLHDEQLADIVDFFFQGDRL